ncbi:hypothetical protein CAEBREN_01062 [Caenorhabditis brenneri]|uniref:Uncharacterized protein n=1 Tax=Caenorhabditis brenneri TaxID=135651 RepID=G0MBE9_CAEBE|nr:hypothetical protein CAEBREN_01062 [Caenorhabditis brenneri]
MSSQPVFKVPRPVPVKKVPVKPVPVRYLISAEELKNMNGKIRSLKKLFKHPRRTLPELQPYLTFLLTGQHSFINLAKVRYSEAGRERMRSGTDAMKHLEDIVIRVILQGEDPARAHLRVINEMYLNNSDEDDEDDEDDTDDATPDIQTSSESPGNSSQPTPKQ